MPVQHDQHIIGQALGLNAKVRTSLRPGSEENPDGIIAWLDGTLRQHRTDACNRYDVGVLVCPLICLWHGNQSTSYG